jgi:hypothetical protein
MKFKMPAQIYPKSVFVGSTKVQYFYGTAKVWQDLSILYSLALLQD